MCDREERSLGLGWDCPPGPPLGEQGLRRPCDSPCEEEDGSLGKGTHRAGVVLSTHIASRKRALPLTFTNFQ